MDMRTNKWHGQIALSGVAVPITESGNLMHLIGLIAKELASRSGRQNRSGEVEITINLRDSKPFSLSDKEGNHTLALAQEVLAGIDTTLVGGQPNEGEHRDSYITRMMNDGNDLTTAQFLASAWYDSTPQAADPALLAWQTDPKAIRFRLLNASSSEFTKALPSEYAGLLEHCRLNHEQFLTGLTLRTA